MSCATCGKPETVCVCERIAVTPVTTTVVVLQHPQEQDRLLGTVPLLEKGVGATRRIGLSWANLAAAIGRDPTERWSVIWPSQLPRELTAQELAAPFVHLVAPRATGREGRGLLVLDGTWSQAKALWWRNPWLLKLDRVVLHPREPSIYGRLRREPRREYVSTLEAVADALVGLGEPEVVRTELRRGMRAMVQRARDADVTAGNSA